MNDKSIKSLAALDDKALKELILEITAALGADSRASAALTQDPARVRALLQSMSDSDMEKLINKAGKEKSAQIYNAIRRRQNNG